MANASNFKRTHAFIMQVWEALYRHNFDQYMSYCNSVEDGSFCERVLEGIRDKLLHCNMKCMEDHAFVEYVEVTTSTETKWDVLYTGFVSFVEDLASRDDTWRFWHDFLFHDCLAYVGLYLATRGGMWNLRMTSLKEMCPLFTAFDRLNYMKILPQHFAEVTALPEEIRHCFVMGEFVCNISGGKMHAVALDEAHEMLVNKDIKTSVVRPSKEYLNRIMYYYPIRSKLCKKLKEQLPFCGNIQQEAASIFDSTPHALRREENVVNMQAKLWDSHVLDKVQDNRGLLALNGTPATPEQQRDLMAFRDIGQQYYAAYVKYFIVRDPIAQVPLRKRCLLTFSAHKRSQKRIKQIERERKLVSRCIRRQLAWSAQTQSVQQHRGEQYLELPRAICTPSGLPHKGQKSYATKFLEKR